jgi:hypothetical protein
MRMNRSKFLACSAGFLALVPLVAAAQTMPPTTQQLQQQHNQTIQTETNTAHSNLTQLQIQQQQVQPPPPTVTRSGRVIANPPGYVPPNGMPGR